MTNFRFLRSQSWFTKEMWPGPWSKAKLTTPNLLNGSARWDFTSTLSKLTCCSSCPFRWQTPSLTMALSTWVFKTSWCRHPSLTVAIWQWHKLWRPGLEALHLVSYFSNLHRWHHVTCNFYISRWMFRCVSLSHGFYILKSLISLYLLHLDFKIQLWLSSS